jgi:predicted porin
VLEYRLDAASNQAVGSNPALLTGQSGPARQQLLGLTNADFGTIAAGRLQTAAYDWAVAFDPLAGSSISPLQFNNGGFNIGATAGHARANSALAYISPTFAGITLAANYALASENVGVGSLYPKTAGVACDTSTAVKTAATCWSVATGTETGFPSTQASATLLSLKSVAGDLAVGVVYDKQSANTVFSAGTNQLDIATGASYNFGVAKLFGTFQTHKIQYQTSAAANADKAYSLSAVVPLGTDAFVGSFSRLIKSSAQPSDLSQTDYTFAYTHPFSKLTTLYTSYSHIGNGLNATKGAGAVGTLSGVGDASASISPTAGGNGQLLVVGINKKF